MMPRTRANQRSILAFDVGNTSVKCAALVHGRWQRLARLATGPVAELAGRLAEKLPAGKARALRPARCVVASVCPAADGAVVEFARSLGVERAEFFGRDIAVPIRMKVREPERVGADRLLSAFAARALREAPCIVVSAGTAITVDLVDAEGCFAGGAIGPGLHLSARALHEHTALLPLVAPAGPPEAAGQDTASAVQAGVYWFCAGGVRALIEQLRQTPGCSGAAVVCTGSDAPLILPALPEGDACEEPDLVFKGMAAALGLAP